MAAKKIKFPKCEFPKGMLAKAVHTNDGWVIHMFHPDGVLQSKQTFETWKEAAYGAWLANGQLRKGTLPTASKWTLIKWEEVA